MNKNITTLQDTTFEVEVNFISLDRDTGNSTYLPIDLASVNYFEIKDDLINFGLTGNITFPNWGQLLSKLPSVFKKGKSDHTGDTESFITIKIKDVDLDESGSEYDDNGYMFLASAKSSASLISNAVDVKQTLDFEEDLTSLLKKISWSVFLENKSGQYGVRTGGNTPLDGARTLAQTIIALINTVNPDTALITESAKELDMMAGGFGVCGDLNIFEGLDGTTSKSLYAIIQEAYNHLVLSEPSSLFGIPAGSKPNPKTLPLLKTQAVERSLEEGYRPGDTTIRKVVLKELISKRHTEFINYYKQEAIKESSDKKKKKEKEKIDYADVYMEEFAIAPSDASDEKGKISTDSSIHNNVEMYDLIQPDINNLRQTLWGDYESIIGDPNNSNIIKYKYNNLVTDFEYFILAGHKSNLPTIPTAETKEFKITNISQPDKGPILAEAKLRNLIYKSFIYLNETIVLNVKGKMYRKPGKFITIKGDLCPTPAEELWYVIEVKHKFENGVYLNEITAVRFLADGPIVPPRGYYDGVNGIPLGYDEEDLVSPLPEGPEALDDLGVLPSLPPDPEEDQGLTDEEKEEARKQGADKAKELKEKLKKLWEKLPTPNFSPDSRRESFLSDNTDYNTPPLPGDDDRAV